VHEPERSLRGGHLDERLDIDVASTGIGAYVALLWVYDLLSQLNEVANPAQDEQGLTLSAAKDKTRARKSAGLDNDF
jgi:hypothetical protein